MEFNRDTYFDYPAIQASGINAWHKSPAKYWAHSPYNPKKKEDNDTDSKLRGNMAHTLVLENKEIFASRYAVAPEGMRFDDRSQEYRAFKAGAGTRKIVKQGKYKEAMTLAIELLKNPVARRIMQQGHIEKPILWEKDGLKCKMRMDFFEDSRQLIVDYKTTTAINPVEYQRELSKWGYHRSGSWYMDGYEKEHGERAQGFAHIIQNTEYPEAIGFFVITDEALQIGSIENDQAFEDIKSRLQSGKWHGFKQEFVNIGLSDFYRINGEWNQ